MVQCKMEAQSGYSTYTVHTDFARLAPNHMLCRHSLRVIVNIVLCFIQNHVHFGIKSSAQLIFFYKQKWHTPFFTELSWKFIEGPLIVGKAIPKNFFFKNASSLSLFLSLAHRVRLHLPHDPRIPRK